MLLDLVSLELVTLGEKGDVGLEGFREVFSQLEVHLYDKLALSRVLHHGLCVAH